LQGVKDYAKSDFMKIYFGDLVHTWEKVGTWTFPLNIGYITEYARKNFTDSLEVRLFKDPVAMIDAIKNDPPDIVALSHYVWNHNLNNRVFEIAKEINPEIMAVGGGPCFTQINANTLSAKSFIARQPNCNAYILNQGERGFLAMLESYRDSGYDLPAFLQNKTDGCLVFTGEDTSPILVGDSLDAIRDLDDIPSPYLSGLLDEFFDGPYIPIIETNRSCPYRCTFCAWGIGTQKLSQFSENRTLAEIEYISQRCTNASNFFIGDANFGILERDENTAAKLRECSDKYGYPAHVVAQWNKTRPDRVFKAAKKLGKLAEIGASMQSLNEDTLTAIKRKNLPLETVVGIINDLRADGVDMPLFTELILGLPEETRETHIHAIKQMIDLGAEVYNYNLHLLPGTEMDSPESREKYFHRTGWRLHDNCYGIYDGKRVFEGQEVVLGTSTMCTDDLRSFRFIHFLLQFMWSRKWYYDFLNLLKFNGLHPVDVALSIAERASQDKGLVGDIYREFRADHELENFGSFEELHEFWSVEDNLQRLKEGSYGKLNYVFTFKILLECYDEFNAFLFRTAEELSDFLPSEDRSVFMAKCDNVLRFIGALRISFQNGLELVEHKREAFEYDILTWREGAYACDLQEAEKGSLFTYDFDFPDQQKQMLNTQLKQFESTNANQLLRQMSVDTSPDQFFYRVKPLLSDNSA
jgi:radical SAM superfamily enzyme YgiQ (UPF0313 family)